MHVDLHYTNYIVLMMDRGVTGGNAVSPQWQPASRLARCTARVIFAVFFFFCLHFPLAPHFLPHLASLPLFLFSSFQYLKSPQSQIRVGLQSGAGLDFYTSIPSFRFLFSCEIQSALTLLSSLLCPPLVDLLIIMLSAIVLTLAAVTTVVNSQYAVTIDPNSVPLSTRRESFPSKMRTNPANLSPEAWCRDQKSTCPLLCLQLPGSNGASVNDCSAVRVHLSPTSINRH